MNYIPGSPEIEESLAIQRAAYNWGRWWQFLGYINAGIAIWIAFFSNVQNSRVLTAVFAGACFYAFHQAGSNFKIEKEEKLKRAGK